MERIFDFFKKEPEREFHVRELAKLTKKSPTTISKYLSKLEKDNLLISKYKFNHKLFKANSENPSFKDIKLFYNIEILRNSGLINYLIEEFNHPEAILLFGSFRKAENNQHSDIDILIITPLKKELNLTKYEKLLDIKIQLFLYSNSDIDKLKNKNKELLNNLVNGIVLYGFWEVFK